VILAILGVGGLVASQRGGWLSRDAEWIPSAIRAQPEVRVAKVIVETGRSADAVVVATGYVESYRQAKIGARAAGRIESVHVEEGTKVKAGEVIAVLDHKDIDAALAAARASLERAEAELSEQDVEIAKQKKELERNDKLRKSNALTEAAYDLVYFQHQAAVAKRDTMKAAVTLAEARVLESEQFRENMIVRAPFDGTVIQKDAEVGESILPGGMGEASGRGSVVTIADLARLEVDCDVKEDYISRVTPGSPAEVAIDAVPDRRYSARVRKVIPMGDRARATIKVKVEILDADERLFPDMGAKVYFLPQPGAEPVVSKERRVFCDTNSIVTSGEDRFVWEVGNELRTKRVNVTVGEDRDGRTEVLEGLSGGERIIVSPSPELREGQLVKIRE
jgi:RND family efflux transporter MFP subunit